MNDASTIQTGMTYRRDFVSPSNQGIFRFKFKLATPLNLPDQARGPTEINAFIV